MDGFYRTDIEAILSEVKHQEKELKLKRRWLMGLPTSTSKSKRKQLRGPDFLKEECLPESWLREDDIFYETVKTKVEETFGAHKFESEESIIEDSIQPFNIPNIKGIVVSCLDALTNNGLYLIAMVLTGGSVSLDRTRSKMKKVIRESLANCFGSQNKELRLGDISKQLFQVLSNPQNFRENEAKCGASTSIYSYAAAFKVLDGLDDFPSYTLIAMNRKLRSIQRLPQLQPHRQGKSRHRLIDQVRRTSKKMLMEVGKHEELPEPLGKALLVADLSLKLTNSCQSSTANIHRIPPEIKNLQNEIVKAIWSLKKLRISELKTLKLLLDPDADISNGSLRTAIKKMLIEYLFECSDMDTVPKSLLEVLATINKSSRTITRRVFPKEEIEEEIECILKVSAQTRQIAWDLLPENQLDEQFADVYMEDLVESDDEDYSLQMELTTYGSSTTHFVNSNCLLEGTDESSPVPSQACTPPITIQSPETEYYTSVGIVPGSFGCGSANDRDEIDVDKENEMDRLCTCCDGNSASPLNSQNRRSNGSSVLEDEIKHNTAVEPENWSTFSSNYLHKNSQEQSTCGNRYLSIQEVCDQASMVVYNLIGQFLDKLAEDQNIELHSKDRLYLRGDRDSSRQEGSQAAEEVRTSFKKNGAAPSIVKMAKELRPSLPKSAIEKINELMGEK